MRNVLFASIFAFSMISCSTMDSNEKVLWVGPELVDCVGVAPMKCMQVKESEDGEWTLFYSKIEGFDYEQGYLYKIRVNVTELDNTPADASSLLYSLVAVDEKEKVKTPPPAQSVRGDLYDRIWRLRSISENGETTNLEEDQEVTIMIKGEDGSISGKAACNNYFGGTSIDGASFQVLKMGSTRKMCADDALMQLEQRYMGLLEQVSRISPDRSAFLTLQTETGAALTFMPVQDK